MRLLTAGVVFGIISSFAGSAIAAADKPAAKAAPGAAAKSDAAPAAKAETKRRGQVPPYYGKVVNDAQRTKIYDIQAKYDDQLDKLEAEINAIKAKREAEIEGLLTPEQLTQVKKLKAESEAASKAKRAKPAEASAAAKTE